MADETCIVCLGDLTTEPTSATGPSPLLSGTVQSHQSRSTSPAAERDDERIAHLLPCQHYLHNSCVQRWVERANSCPICRAKFNKVELHDYVGGPATSTYDVNDKEQIDPDPNITFYDSYPEEEEEEQEWQDPCLLCGAVHILSEQMFCDGCDRPVHVFCTGLHSVPEVWYCEFCIRALETEGDLPLAASPATARPRAPRAPRAPPRQRATRTGTARQPRRNTQRREWARVWQSVWNNLNLDLEFPDDNEPAAELRRTPTQRRDFNAWQRRLRVAGHQGAATRFSETAPALLNEAPPAPESQEVIHAWNAFEKAREALDEAPSRKRKTIDTPEPTQDKDTEPERRLKRPRTRRNLPSNLPAPQAESSHQAMSRVEKPSFLTSLLHEVDKQPCASDNTSPTSLAADDHTPFPLSSPEGSPPTSTHGSPRAACLTPPPLALPRPSYTPLTSIVRPLSSPVGTAYSPFSPADKDRAGNGNRQPRPQESSPKSPSHHLSYSTKREIQRMVKNSLGPRYRNGEISKDQYTDINRDVSRMMYEVVEGASDLFDTERRDRLQNMACSEVGRAVEALKA